MCTHPADESSGLVRYLDDGTQIKRVGKKFCTQWEHSQGHRERRMQWLELLASRAFQVADEVAEVRNVQVFKALQMHRTLGNFFWALKTMMNWLWERVGRQSSFMPRSSGEFQSITWVGCIGKHLVGLKVFKKGAFVHRLQSQWLQGLLLFYVQ